MADKYDLVELRSKPARLDKHSLPQYCLIYNQTKGKWIKDKWGKDEWFDGRLINTGICLHITQIKELKKYKQYKTTPLILLSEPMDFFEEHGFLIIQKLTAVWEINEIAI